MFVTAPKELSPSPRQLDPVGDVAAGQTVEVPDAVGESLIEQGWAKASVKPPKVAEVLAEVGDDPVKAAAEIAAEEVRDNPRPSLIEKLTAVIAANPTPSPDGDDHKES